MDRLRQTGAASSSSAAAAAAPDQTPNPNPTEGSSDPGSSQAGGPEVGEGAGGSGADAEPAAKNKLECFKCDKVATRASELRLVSDGEAASWQGRIWGYCFECSKMDDLRKFTQLAKRSWENRSRELHGKLDRARRISFTNAHEMFRTLFPGASNTRCRELAYKRTKAAAAAIVSGLHDPEREKGVNEEVQKIALGIAKNYLRELELCVHDPTYTVTPAGHTLTGEEASYLTSIARGVTVSFMCRQKDCLFWGMNDADTWIKDSGRYHFKCPLCGTFFQPGVWSEKVVEANFMFGMTDPVTGEMSSFPCVWPVSEETDWIYKQAELEARQIKTRADVDAWHNKSKVDLSELLKKQRVPASFERLPYSCPDERVSAKWQYAHIKARGFVMGRRATVEEVQVPYKSWNELIGLVANVLASARALVLEP